MSTLVTAEPILVENSVKERNDNSNPQQGTGGVRPVAVAVEVKPAETRKQSKQTHEYVRPSLKIPPTQKDERKLFVGGLPANGK